MSFFQGELIALVLTTKFVCRCQNPFALMCPLRKAEDRFRFMFEQVSFWCCVSLEKQFEDLSFAKCSLRVLLEV